MYIVYHYPKCSTCKKAVKWLKEHSIEVELRHIVEETPSVTILEDVYNKSGLPIRRLFNTSGIKYRELNMKEKLNSMTNKEAFDILASEGMLIKRPIIMNETVALIGFKEAEWVEKIK